MTNPLPIPVKTQLEDTLAQALYDFLGATSPDAIADLPASQRLKEATGSFLLLAEDTGNGPLVRLAQADGSTNILYELGLGDSIAALVNEERLNVVGVTGRYRNAKTAANARDLLEALVRHVLAQIQVSDIESAFSVGYESAVMLKYVTHTFKLESATGQKPAPILDVPVAAGGNTSTGQITSQADGVYSGQSDATYTVEVVTANTSPGSLTGLMWRWKKGSGAFSSAVTATGNWQTLSNNVQIKFALSAGQTFVSGNSWTIAASATGTEYTGIFAQTWQITTQQQSGS